MILIPHVPPTNDMILNVYTYKTSTRLCEFEKKTQEFNGIVWSSRHVMVDTFSEKTET